MQSLSSLAKKTLFNQQQQRKLAKRKQVNPKDVTKAAPANERRDYAHKQHDQEIKSLQQQQASKEREFSKLNALFQEFEKQQLEKKLVRRGNNDKVIELPADCKFEAIPSLPAKLRDNKEAKQQQAEQPPVRLTKNQRKKLKKQAKKNAQKCVEVLVETETNPNNSDEEKARDR